MSALRPLSGLYVLMRVEDLSADASWVKIGDLTLVLEKDFNKRQWRIRGDLKIKSLRTVLHSVQPVGFPGLQSLQKFFDPLLQFQAVTIESSDSFMVVGFGSRCFPPAASKWWLRVRTPCLTDAIHERSRGFCDFGSNPSQG